MFNLSKEENEKYYKMTKDLNENIKYFIVDDEYDLIKNRYNITKYYDFNLIDKTNTDIVVDIGDYYIYLGNGSYNKTLLKNGHKAINKLILKKNKIYSIENNYPSNAFCIDETGEKYDIMNIWHDICLFSPNKKQLERKIKYKTII
jgi:hypothetical protein